MVSSNHIDIDKRDAAFKLIDAGLSPTNAARQVGLARSTIYREPKKRAYAVPA